MLPWAIIRIHSRVALDNLDRQAFEYYYPLVRTRQRLKTRRKTTFRTVPLFYEYVFVRVTGVWRSLMSTIGVSQVLMTEHEKPAIVPDEFVSGIRSLEDKEGIVVLPKTRFRKGQKLRIRKGPMEKAICIYKGQSSADRVRVLLKLFGSERIIELREGDLVEA